LNVIWACRTGATRDLLKVKEENKPGPIHKEVFEKYYIEHLDRVINNKCFKTEARSAKHGVIGERRVSDEK
jgi:hypothetical protein